jgi:hypothetical protein
MHIEVAERAFEMQRSGILRESLGPNYKRHGIAEVRKTSADCSAGAPGAENCVCYWGSYAICLIDMVDRT